MDKVLQVNVYRKGIFKNKRSGGYFIDVLTEKLLIPGGVEFQMTNIKIRISTKKISKVVKRRTITCL